MEKVTPWPMVPDEIKAHAMSLVIGRYFTTPALLSHLNLSDWLAMVAVFLECETRKLVADYREQLPELPASQEGPILAEELIRRWKSDASIRERFPIFLDYVESVERAIERGFPINN
jgi:hypothetical protein